MPRLRVVPPLAVLCIVVLARLPDVLAHAHPRRIPATPALLDALAPARDPCLWATLAQLVHPLPPHLHDHDLPLSHPALPLLQKIPDSPDFSLVSLVSLPNCTLVRDADIASLRTLHRLLALDLRGCPISSYAITVFARGLVAPSIDDPTRSGPWGLRLLSLHGCPNIDDDALSVLHRFPLLSVIDLRFTRCTPATVNARLSPLGFRPSGNNSLFHPAPASLALCSLEKVALTASDPISLYSCPPQLVFRVHIDGLSHLPSQTKKVVPVDGPSTSTIRTISSAEDTIVFIPPLQKHAESATVSSAVVPVSPSIDRPTQPSPVSNASSFYENAHVHSKKNILPLSAQAVHSSKGGKLDPLAIARSPPPWKVLDTNKSLALSDPPVTVAYSESAADNVENSRRRQPIARWTGRSLSSSIKVDRTRLYKRGSDAVADMVHQFTSKRPKIVSEFVLAKAQAKPPVKLRNPFVRNARSVFAESSTNASDKPRSPVHGSSKEAEPDVQLRVCRSLPSETVRQQGAYVRETSKPLKPITTLKPPILPKELLPSLPQRASKPKTNLKQTRLAFAREVG